MQPAESFCPTVRECAPTSRPLAENQIAIHMCTGWCLCGAVCDSECLRSKHKAELAAKDIIVRQTMWRAEKAELQAASLIKVQQELAETQQQLRTQKMLAADEVAALQGRLQEAAHSSKVVADVCQQRVQHVEQELNVRSLYLHVLRGAFQAFLKLPLTRTAHVSRIIFELS
jgi:hypothetical protein